MTAYKRPTVLEPNYHSTRHGVPAIVRTGWERYHGPPSTDRVSAASRLRTRAHREQIPCTYTAELANYETMSGRRCSVPRQSRGRSVEGIEARRSTGRSWHYYVIWRCSEGHTGHTDVSTWSRKVVGCDKCAKPRQRRGHSAAVGTPPEVRAEQKTRPKYVER